MRLPWAIEPPRRTSFLGTRIENGGLLISGGRAFAIDQPRSGGPWARRAALEALGWSVGGRRAIRSALGARRGLREITLIDIRRPPAVQRERAAVVSARRRMGVGSSASARPARLARELAYTSYLGLNMIRLEGKLESDDFYDRADESGIVLLPGWMCCDVWEKQRGWNDTHRLVARESMRSQAARLRNHASVGAFLIGSDKAPPSDVAMAYTEALKSGEWPNPIIHAASAEGDSGLKMPGPYDWVPPHYWFEDKTHGGAFGFNSEAGPGPAIPELEVMKTFMSPRDLDALWTKPNAPQFHAGAPGRKFQTLRIFQQALRARLGAPTSLEDWVKKAQRMNYEAERAEFEAYASRKYAGTTGIVHWLLNSPWPSLIWHLYDWSLLPAAGFYGAKKANEPLHALFAYDDRSVIVVNNAMQSEPNLSVVARVLDLEGTERASEILEVNVAADASARAGAVPLPAGLSGVHLVELELRRGADVVSTNTYVVPEHEEAMNYRATTWLYTPTTNFDAHLPMKPRPQP
jgi:exo-1,4-beta-D-glucosaminidase